MLKRLALALCLLPGAGFAQSLWQSDGARVQTVSYGCTSAFDELSVAYFTPTAGMSFAAVQIGGIVRAMVQDISGSGVRFVATDPQSGYRLHVKGDNLMLFRLLAEDPTNEQLLAECSAQNG
jgi:membrane-bound inhibitor of C-type lysozyme